MYSNPSKIDTIFNIEGHTNRIVSALINKEEIVEKIWVGGTIGDKPFTMEPDWDSIEKSIKQKYGSSYSTTLIPSAKISFYFQTKNWKKYVFLIEKAMLEYPPKEKQTEYRFANYVGGIFGDDSWALNDIAWALFLKCNDKECLEKALKWSDQSLKLCKDSSVIFQYIDTKANLVYKLNKLFKKGTPKEAIQIEEKALGFKMPAFVKETYLSTINKMKIGENTWPE